MAVEAEDLLEELSAKTIHDSHDDDQSCDAEHDADQREAGDDRNRCLLAPSAQIAPGDEPLEAGKRTR